MKALIGTGVALVTPFTSNGQVDVTALEKLVNYQIDNGIEYLVVLGTTGEASVLNNEERKLVKDTVIHSNDGRLPLVLGLGGNNTAAVCEQLRTEDLAGFDAILSVSPYYSKPTQDGIYKHFEAVSEASPLPIILYNVPGRTSSNMMPTTIASLAVDFENIVAIKEAAGDIVQAMDIISSTPTEFHTISGDDMTALAVTLAGGSGVISVAGQGFPDAFSTMIRHGLAGESKQAHTLLYAMAPMIDMIFQQGNPAGIKSVLAARGIVENHLRLPLVPVDGALDDALSEFVRQFDQWHEA